MEHRRSLSQTEVYVNGRKRKDLLTVDKYGIFNEVLVRLFRDIMDIEEKAIITPEFKDITNNDMHVIGAIGTGAPKNILHRQRTVGDRGHSDHRHEQPGEKGICGPGTGPGGPEGGLYFLV